MTAMYYSVRVGKTPGVYDTLEDARIQVNGFPYSEMREFGDLTEANVFARSGSFYAVRNGYNIGIYTCPDAVYRQSRVPRFECRKFDTLAEAEEYMESDPQDYRCWYYAVRNGRNKGVFTNWDAALNQIHGYPDAEWEKHYYLADAYIYLNGGSGHYRLHTMPGDSHCYKKKSMLDDLFGGKRHRLLIGAQSVARPTKDIYVHGSTINKGRTNVSSGFGVFWGDKRSCCGRIPGAGTSDFAELVAIEMALSQICASGSQYRYVIHTGSGYAIERISNDRDRKVGVNAERIASIRTYLQALAKENVEVDIQAQGRAQLYGREMAGALARQARLAGQAGQAGQP